MTDICSVTKAPQCACICFSCLQKKYTVVATLFIFPILISGCVIAFSRNIITIALLSCYDNGINLFTVLLAVVCGMNHILHWALSGAFGL